MTVKKQTQGFAERIEFWKNCDLDARLTAFTNFINRTREYNYVNLAEATKYFGSCLAVYIKEYDIADINMLHYLSECEKFFVRKVTPDYENFDQVPKAQALTVHSTLLCGFNGALAAVQDYLDKKDNKLDTNEKKFYDLSVKLSAGIEAQMDYNRTFHAKVIAGYCFL